MCNQKLDPNEILISEFKYAAQTAIQANEDRARIYSYLLTTAGTMIAAVAIPTEKTNLYFTIFSVLLSALTVMGFMSLLKLAKLRIAWANSVEAMSKIKDFYIEKCRKVGLENAFLWKKETIPPIGKKWTVAFLMALSIGSISGASASGAVLFGSLATLGELYIIHSLFIGLIVFIVQILMWHFICCNKS